MKHKRIFLFSVLQKQIQNIENERNTLIQTLNECQQAAAEIETEDRFKENVIKSLDNSIEDNNNNLESDRESRGKEIQLLIQSNHDAKKTLSVVQQQYNESLEKILDQNSLIRELQEKIVDCEYISQRNLRG